MFRATGDICRCTVYLDHPKNQVGNFKDGEVKIYEELNKAWVEKILDTDCTKCNLLPTCFNKNCRMSFLKEKRKSCPKLREFKSIN